MLIKIDKGQKVKIKAITFEGNEKIDDKKLRKAMKNTKKKNFIRILKRSKYIEEDYKTDLVSVVDFYKENGYKDRNDYLECLADEYDINPRLVYITAQMLGENEDFDGLVTTIQDQSGY